MNNNDSLGQPVLDGEEVTLLGAQNQSYNQKEQIITGGGVQYPTDFSKYQSDKPQPSSENNVNLNFERTLEPVIGKAVEEESKQVIIQGPITVFDTHQQIGTNHQVEKADHLLETGSHSVHLGDTSHLGVTSHIGTTSHLATTSNHGVAPHINTSDVRGHGFLDRFFSQFHGLGSSLICCHDRKRSHVTSTISHNQTPHIDTVAVTLNCRNCGESSLKVKVLVNETCKHTLCIDCLKLAVEKGTCLIPGCDKLLDIRELNNLVDPLKVVHLETGHKKAKHHGHKH